MRSEEAVRREIGWALHARAREVGDTVLGRLGQIGLDTPVEPAPRIQRALARTASLATEVVGRWLATGDAVRAGEMRYLAAPGSLAGTLPLAGLVKAYLAWRDVTIAVLDEEGAKRGASGSLLAEARSMVARSCDVSLVRMTRQFDDERRRLQAELAAERAKLAHQALHDPLTGLANRTLLAERLRHAAEAAERYRESVAVLFVDLDGFKAVNDNLGHDAGDQVLIMLAQRLAQIVRPSDTVARLGGDEFVILCERLLHAEEEAVAIAERVLTALRHPCLVAGRDIVLPASIGIAVGSRADEAERLVCNADAAMYVAKERGGAGYEVYEDQRGPIAA